MPRESGRITRRDLLRMVGAATAGSVVGSEVLSLIGPELQSQELSPVYAASTYLPCPQILPPIEERCGETSLPSEIFETPARFDVEEGRLIGPLRAAAHTQNPIEILIRSAIAFFSWGRPSPLLPPSDGDLAKALADLAVTGRNAFARFRAALPNDEQLFVALQGRVPSSLWVDSPDDLYLAGSAARDRAYQVAAALRGGPALRAQARPPRPRWRRRPT